MTAKEVRDILYLFGSKILACKESSNVKPMGNALFLYGSQLAYMGIIIDNDDDGGDDDNNNSKDIDINDISDLNNISNNGSNSDTNDNMNDN